MLILIKFARLLCFGICLEVLLAFHFFLVHFEIFVKDIDHLLNLLLLSFYDFFLGSLLPLVLLVHLHLFEVILFSFDVLLDGEDNIHLEEVLVFIVLRGHTILFMVVCFMCLV